MRYENVDIHNAAEVTRAPDGIGSRFFRVPASLIPKLNGSAQNGATRPAGVEIRFNLPQDGKVAIRLLTRDTNILPAIATVWQGCFRTQQVLLETGEVTELTVGLPGSMPMLPGIARAGHMAFDPALTRICLPPLHEVRLLSISGDPTPPRPEQLPARRYLAYGSSITHGAHPVNPQGSYACQTARRLGADLINLGFGGGAHMERELAAFIAARDDWDFASLEMGINVMQWGEKKFRDAVRPFVRTLADAHPDKWLFCIDMFTFFGDFDRAYTVGDEYRRVVEEEVAAIGSDRVVRVDGRALLTDPAGLSGDMVHPTDDGMYEMGERLAAFITERIGR